MAFFDLPPRPGRGAARRARLRRLRPPRLRRVRARDGLRPPQGGRRVEKKSEREKTLTNDQGTQIGSRARHNEARLQRSGSAQIIEPETQAPCWAPPPVAMRATLPTEWGGN